MGVSVFLSSIIEIRTVNTILMPDMLNKEPVLSLTVCWDVFFVWEDLNKMSTLHAEIGTVKTFGIIRRQQYLSNMIAQIVDMILKL